MNRDPVLTRSFLYDTGLKDRFQQPAPTARDLRRLTPSESARYDDIRANRLGHRMRLEQERIGFRWLQIALNVL